MMERHDAFRAKGVLLRDVWFRRRRKREEQTRKYHLLLLRNSDFTLWTTAKHDQEAINSGTGVEMRRNGKRQEGGRKTDLSIWRLIKGSKEVFLSFPPPAAASSAPSA